MSSLTFRSLAAGLLALSLLAGPALAADNVAVTAGSGKTMACKDISTVCYTQHMLSDSGGTDMSDTTLHGLKTVEQTLYAATITTTIARPADTSLYTAKDAWADSTSAPTAGGFTLTNACRTSGGSGMITSLGITSSVDPTVLLQGELWIFDSSVTAVNDNAVFTVSDTDVAKLIPAGPIPFALASTSTTGGTNSTYGQANLNAAYTCVGTANLRFLVKVTNGYTPASGEVLTVRAAVVATN